MGEVGIGGEFDFFGIDHDEFDFVRAWHYEDGHDDGIDADGFTGSCCPCNDAVRHFCQIAHHVFAIDGFA